MPKTIELVPIESESQDLIGALGGKLHIREEILSTGAWNAARARRTR